MTNDPQYVAAIDIGTSNIVSLVGYRAADGKVAIVGRSVTPSSGMAKGDVRNVEQMVASINNSVKALSDEFNIRICEAYVGLSGQHIKCTQLDGYVFVKNRESEVSREDVAELSDSMSNIQIPAGETIIHILPQTYTLDGESDISEPVGMIGRKLGGLFNIIIGMKQNLSHLERCFKRADINIASVIMSSLASAESILLDDEKELGVIVADIGGGTTDVCIYYDKTVRYLGVIPIGGNFINKDIKSYGVLERHVEKLKVKFGSAVSDIVPENQIITLQGVNNTPSKEISKKTLASIIEARMIDIIEELQKILDKTELKNKIKGPIVLTGGSAMMKDIDKLFAFHLGKDVRIASPTFYVTPDSIDFIDSPLYSTAVGLLIKGLDFGKPTQTFIIKKSSPIYSEEQEYAPKVSEQKVVFPQNNNVYNPNANSYKSSRDVTIEPQPQYNIQQPNKNEDDIENIKKRDENNAIQQPKKGFMGRFFQTVKEVFDPEDLDDEEDTIS